MLGFAQFFQFDGLLGEEKMICMDTETVIKFKRLAAVGRIELLKNAETLWRPCMIGWTPCLDPRHEEQFNLDEIFFELLIPLYFIRLELAKGEQHGDNCPFPIRDSQLMADLEGNIVGQLVKGPHAAAVLAL